MSKGLGIKHLWWIVPTIIFVGIGIWFLVGSIGESAEPVLDSTDDLQRYLPGITEIGDFTEEQCFFEEQTLACGTTVSTEDQITITYVGNLGTCINFMTDLGGVEIRRYKNVQIYDNFKSISGMDAFCNSYNTALIQTSSSSLTDRYIDEYYVR